MTHPAGHRALFMHGGDAPRARVLAYAGLCWLSLVLGGCVTTAPRPVAERAPLTGPIELGLALASGSAIPTLGELPKRFASEVARRSDDEVRFKIYEPGVVATASELLDAVSRGEVDAGFSSALLATPKDPAFTWFAAFPFSPDMRGHWKWMSEGGGVVLLEQLYRPYHIMPITCGYMGPEGQGWFRAPISSPADLDGIKMRFFGLGALVLRELGVETQRLAGPDIYPALDKGVIDATEFSTPYIDQGFGFPAVAKYYYYPGVHQFMAMQHLLVNLDTWSALPPERQTLLVDACNSNIEHSFESEPAKIAAGLRTLESQGAVVAALPDSVVEAARIAWGTVLTRELARSEKSREIHASLAPYLP